MVDQDFTQNLTWEQVNALAERLSRQIDKTQYDCLYGIPRGGIHVAQMLTKYLSLPLSTTVRDRRTLVVDDIVDSGSTIEKYKDNDVAALHFKAYTKALPTYFGESTDKWICYPWEHGEHLMEDTVTRFLEGIGENPNREGLLDTPKRVAKAWKQEWAWGYGKVPHDYATAFTNPGVDQLIMVPKIDFYSHCEHHLAPFYGQIHVGYIPKKKVLGVSKFARIIDIYSKRLQIQERLVQEVANAINEVLDPQGVAVVGRATHLCMRSRGVQKQNSEMVTSVMLGKFRDEAELRAEFLTLIK